MWTKKKIWEILVGIGIVIIVLALIYAVNYVDRAVVPPKRRETRILGLTVLTEEVRGIRAELAEIKEGLKKR